MKKLLLIATLAVATIPFPAAHAGAGHDHGPRHGGVVREKNAISYELVAKADSLTLHVSDHGKPIDTAGARAEVTLHAGSEKTTVALLPAGDNRLSAKGQFKVGVGVRAALTVTLAGRPEAKLSYNLK